MLFSMYFGAAVASASTDRALQQTQTPDCARLDEGGGPASRRNAPNVGLYGRRASSTLRFPSTIEARHFGFRRLLRLLYLLA